MNYYISKPIKIEEMRMDFERSCVWQKAEQTLDRASIDNLRQLQMEGKPDIQRSWADF